MKRLLVALFALCSLAFGGVASAANAYSQGIVHLRAGPSTEYPIVMSIPPSSLLQVSGCLDDYTWCDVDWEGNRGWVYGNYLYYDYQDRRVPVLGFGAALGIGIVSFSIGDYWPRYYASRPWYGRESYWMHRPPPPRRPHPPRPRPPVRPAPPPRPVHPPRPPRPSPPVRPTPGRPRPDPSRPGPSRPNPSIPKPGPGNGGPGNSGPGGGGRPPPQTRPAPQPGSPPGPN